MKIFKSPLAWCSLLAIVVQFCFGFPTEAIHGDSPRFAQQAEWLARGEGYLGKETWTVSGTGIRLETTLPPGYPVFLALIFTLTGPGETFLRAVQFVQLGMSLGSCYFVYFAIRPRSSRLALLAFVTLATSFSSVGISRYLMSETLAVFLIAAIVWLISRIEVREGGIAVAFFTGFTSVAVLLTAPATIVLGFCTWCYAFWKFRNRYACEASLVLGSLLLMLPWQLHCWRATGQVQVAVFTGSPVWNAGFTKWYRTWAWKESDHFVFWQPKPFRELPDSVFASREQREHLTELDQRVLDSVGYKLNHYTPDVDAAFREAAVQRIAAEPIRYYLTLPSLRALTLWFHCEVWEKAVALPEKFAFSRFLVEGDSLLARAAVTMIGLLIVTIVNAVPFLLFVVLIYCGVRALRQRQAMPLIIFLSVAMYAAISATSGLGELRRDFPFYPAILFMLFYLGPPGNLTVDGIGRRISQG